MRRKARGKGGRRGRGRRIRNSTCSGMRGGPAVRQCEVIERVDSGNRECAGPVGGVLEALNVREGAPV